MSKHDSNPAGRNAPREDQTLWQRLADTEPIRIRDPVAEVLGMVPEEEPLVVTFADVAKAAGHACPAVAGAYRGSQLALDRLYPEEYPVRSEVGVVIGGSPEDPGLGPMSSVIRHITGAADETGFGGLGGIGGREHLLSFGDVDGVGRSFRFERLDSGAEVVISFDPTSAGADSTTSRRAPIHQLPTVVSGDADEEETASFRDQWHGRVQRILDAPADGGPFKVAEVQ